MLESFPTSSIGGLRRSTNEKRNITADTALSLSKALGTTAECWMNLQARYDLDHTRDESGSKIDKEVHPLITS